jgi:hypothetical protein
VPLNANTRATRLEKKIPNTLADPGTLLSLYRKEGRHPSALL